MHERENPFHAAYADAYQLICLTRRIPVVLSQHFRVVAAKARNPHLPNIRTTTRDKGNNFQGWAICTDGGTPLVHGETLAGSCVIARSHPGRIDVMFGPVLTTEAGLALAGARTHSNNTVEMTAMIEALSFLGPHGPIARDTHSL